MSTSSNFLEGHSNKICSLSSRNLLVILLVLVEACSCQFNSDNSKDIIDNLNSTSSPQTNKPTVSLLNDISIHIAPSVTHFGVVYVATDTKLDVSAEVSGSGYNESLLVYEWSTKDGVIKAPANAKHITHTFTKPDEENYLKVTVTDTNKNEFISTTYLLEVRAPVEVLTPDGKLFLERGELLEISLKYKGSPPFNYCYKFCTPYDILPCSLCFPSYETTNTVIPIKHYFHNVGNYTLAFYVENVLNNDEKQYAIKINDSIRKSNLPVAPIVSSILAVIILMSGLGLHLKYRVTSYATETANFDFFNGQEDEDWEREFSFIQRVKYLFCGISGEDDVDETRYLLRKSSPESMSSSSGHGTNTTTTTTAPVDD